MIQNTRAPVAIPRLGAFRFLLLGITVGQAEGGYAVRHRQFTANFQRPAAISINWTALNALFSRCWRMWMNGRIGL